MVQMEQTETPGLDLLSQSINGTQLLCCKCLDNNRGTLENMAVLRDVLVLFL